MQNLNSVEPGTNTKLKKSFAFIELFLYAKYCPGCCVRIM